MASQSVEDVLDGRIIKDLYEKMRAGAIAPSRSTGTMNSYGNSVLNGRGLLAWAKSCAKLQLTAPLPRPSPSSPRRDPQCDGDQQLMDILTQMALCFVEGT
jgi:hypothetical protein